MPTPSYNVRDFIGKPFGAWTVIGRGKPDNQGRPRLQCKCWCGNKSDIRATLLVNGSSKSCRSCAQRGNKKSVTHGHMIGARNGQTSPTYRSWKSMVQRCTNPNASQYAEYGGGGIKVCVAWRGDGGFQKFLADVGARPSLKHTLDRWPNRVGNYKPGNVRWATKSEQQRNRRDNATITFGGGTRTIYEWSDLYSIKAATLYRRLRSGWSAERTLCTPPIGNERVRRTQKD